MGQAYKRPKGGDAWVPHFVYGQLLSCIVDFLGKLAGTAEEQAKNFRWGLHKSILDRVLCIEFTDVAQVAVAVEI
ncbi:hypothetical protein Tco_1032743 [Tanacetum coccineum]|uniref:Zinc finger, CCHC-type, retrotransposon Gag domain protein n=1 Tax=Tanacetum coccineum TaxID=301880 RepID=A0ABQ5GCN7_9ASTR